MVYYVVTYSFRCPYAGCGNTVPVRMEDLTDNVTLKEYISKMASKPNTQLTWWHQHKTILFEKS